MNGKGFVFTVDAVFAIIATVSLISALVFMQEMEKGKENSLEIAAQKMRDIAMVDYYTAKNTCNNGEITSDCYCGGTLRTVIPATPCYCCDASYQAVPCPPGSGEYYYSTTVLEYELPNETAFSTGGKIAMVLGMDSSESMMREDVGKCIAPVGSAECMPPNTWILDSSGNGNTGSLNGWATGSDMFVAGKQGNALHFGGSGDNVSVDSVSPAISAGSVSVAAWIKLPENYGNGSAQEIIFRLGDSPSDNDVHLSFGADDADGKLYFSIFNGEYFIDAVSSQSSWTADTWYFVAGTYDSSVTKVYINGALAGQTTSSTRGTTASEHATIGGSYNDIGPKYFKGAMDNLMIYNKALTPAEVNQLYNGSSIPNGPLALWDFDNIRKEKTGCASGECKLVKEIITGGTCIPGGTCGPGTTNCYPELTANWKKIGKFNITPAFLSKWAAGDILGIRVGYGTYNGNCPSQQRVRVVKKPSSGPDPIYPCEESKYCYGFTWNYDDEGRSEMEIIGNQLSGAGPGEWEVYAWSDMPLNIRQEETFWYVKRDAVIIPGSQNAHLLEGLGEECNYKGPPSQEGTVYNVGNSFPITEPAGLPIANALFYAEWTGYNINSPAAQCGTPVISMQKNSVDFCGGIAWDSELSRWVPAGWYYGGGSTWAGIYDCGIDYGKTYNNGDSFQMKIWSDHQKITVSRGFYNIVTQNVPITVDTATVSGGLCDTSETCTSSQTSCSIATRANYTPIATLSITNENGKEYNSINTHFSYSSFGGSCSGTENNNYHFPGFMVKSPPPTSTEYIPGEGNPYGEYTEGYFGASGGGYKYVSGEPIESGTWTLYGWTTYDNLPGTNFYANVNTKRTNATKNSAKNFASSSFWQPTDKFGIMSFSDDAIINQALENANDPNINNVIAAIPASGGGTALAAAINKAVSELESAGLSSDYSKYIVLLTDGQANVCTNSPPYAINCPSNPDTCCEAQAISDAIAAADTARDNGITVYVIGFADSSIIGTYEDKLKQVAKDKDSSYCTGGENCGKYYFASDEELLDGIYRGIGEEIGSSAIGSQGQIIRVRKIGG